MGGPQNATCQGFTIDEFGKLDLSKMDLTEFVDEVTAIEKNLEETDCRARKLDNDKKKNE